MNDEERGFPSPPNTTHIVERLTWLLPEKSSKACRLGSAFLSFSCSLFFCFFFRWWGFSSQCSHVKTQTLWISEQSPGSTLLTCAKAHTLNWGMSEACRCRWMSENMILIMIFIPSKPHRIWLSWEQMHNVWIDQSSCVYSTGVSLYPLSTNVCKFLLRAFQVKRKPLSKKKVEGRNYPTILHFKQIQNIIQSKYIFPNFCPHFDAEYISKIFLLKF